MSIHQELKRLRKEKFKSAIAASEFLNKHQCYWHRLESGRKTLNIDTLQNIRSVLGPLTVELLVYAGVGPKFSKLLIEEMSLGKSVKQILAKELNAHRAKLKDLDEWGETIKRACLEPFLSAPKITLICKGKYDIPIMHLALIFESLKLEKGLA